MPEIFYWNLRASSFGSKPVTQQAPGVAMLSGFSPCLMSAFLKGRLENLTPLGQLMALLDDAHWSRLTVAAPMEIKEDIDSPSRGPAAKKGHDTVSNAEDSAEPAAKVAKK